MPWSKEKRFMNALRKRPLTRFAILLCCAATASGCSSTKPVILTAETLCKDWKVQTKSKNDKLTIETAATMAASNAARPEYGCYVDRNEARS